MKEWDIDAYSRRWRNSYGFFSVSKETQLRYGFFAEFWGHGTSRIGVSVVHATGKADRYVLEDLSEEYPTARLEYIPVEAGWYDTTSGCMAMLTRRHHRGYQVGVCQYNHEMMAVDEAGRDVDPGSPVYWAGLKLLYGPKITPYKPGNPFGVLSRKLWYRNDQLFFLQRCIGQFRGEKLVVENSAFVPHVRPLLGDACQIVAL